MNAGSTDKWCDFEQGTTLATQGSESGVIVLDEEYDQRARISLERAARVAPFAITCGVYGRLMHTRYFGSEAEAKSKYDAMKLVLKLIVDGIDSPDEQVRRCAVQALYDFADRFPTRRAGSDPRGGQRCHN
jgi:hypothetical protein